MGPEIMQVPVVAVGGVGGSGTRLVAHLMMELGYYLGSDLNESLDTLWFTLLFKRPEILAAPGDEIAFLTASLLQGLTGTVNVTPEQVRRIWDLASQDRDQHPASWLAERAESLLAQSTSSPDRRRMGWKEPNTHLVMDRLPLLLPQMRYIHVMRNGLDMAYSRNQNQLRLWGRYLVGPDCQDNPRYALKYWCRAHRRILRLCRPLGGRFMLLNYDALCASPEFRIRELLEFLGCEPSPQDSARLIDLVQKPESVGRFKQQSLDQFDPEDVAYVRELGFDTSTA